jgi:hypothetical protein
MVLCISDSYSQISDSQNIDEFVAELCLALNSRVMKLEISNFWSKLLISVEMNASERPLNTSLRTWNCIYVCPQSNNRTIKYFHGNKCRTKTVMNFSNQAYYYSSQICSKKGNF